MLVRLIYASRSCSPITSELVKHILDAAHQHNPQSGITGVLCYGDDVFVQALEGGRAEVNALYQHICRDDRHRDVTLLAYQEIDQREFASWSMAQAPIDKKNAALLLRHSSSPVLDPFRLSGSTTTRLLSELGSSGGLRSRG
ncbi:blue light sensor protein [Aquitalea sp. FJL05]|uniref:BLUF domain-containing protein n=1 Tax=Aquitalea TaxID=407217 RepID=UPI000F59F4CF|nr:MULTISPECIES: BLUF domain-containing protein [Aquitalea]RQO75995.1 blue light sensor protein [Aquitalea sp. FJL05]